MLTSYENWQQWAKQYTHLPQMKQYPLGLEGIVSWEEVWQRCGQYSFLLESGKTGRYTFFGKQPNSIIRGKGMHAVISNQAGGQHEQHHVSGNPFDLVREWMSVVRVPKVHGAPKFNAGCVGFWGYDVGRYIEKLPAVAEDDLELPDYAFMRTDEIWILDHQEKKLICAAVVPLPLSSDEAVLAQLYGESVLQVERMHEFWMESVASCQTEPNWRTALWNSSYQDINIDMQHALQKSFTKEQFVHAVHHIQDYIAQGDVFQVNLSVRQHRPILSSAEDIYEWLRIINPSPYMGLLRFPDFQLVSGSPELLVGLQDGKVQTRPIAGTRPRGKLPVHDAALKDELFSSEKERAEHIMLVDLLRNDLGRISRYGSVKVTELMAVEHYSHVMHIVSHVVGELADQRDAYDVIRAVFPGGTITGAPKVRTMEIIEELEPLRRGMYTGSLGWIDSSGNMEFNIIIRTLVMKDGIGYVQAGAGIVIDSAAEKEYDESLNKAKALWKAIECSEQYWGRGGRNDFGHR